MKAIYAAVMDVKHLRSTAMCRVSVEIPEEFFAEAAQYLNRRVLVTLSPDLGRGYGIVEPREEAPPEEPAPKNVSAIGPLCKLAAQLCKQQEFIDWLKGCGYLLPFGGVSDEEWAKGVICSELGIMSRKEIDGDPIVASQFHEQFRIPFAARHGVAA